MLKILEYLEKMATSADRTKGRCATLMSASEARTFAGLATDDDDYAVYVSAKKHVARTDLYYVGGNAEVGKDWIGLTGIDVVVGVQRLTNDEFQVVVWDGDQVHLIDNCTSVRYVRELLKEDGFTMVTIGK